MAWKRSRLVGRRVFQADWADGSVSASQTELFSAEAGEDITFFRAVYPADTQLYGEEYDLKQGSTDNLYLIKPKDSPWVLVGALDQDSQSIFFEEFGAEGVARLGHLILQYYDGKQVTFIEDLIAMRPESSPPLLVHAAMPCIIALKKGLSETTLSNCRLSPIKNKTILEIEEGRVMRFQLTPSLKLPEAMVAFDPKSGTLFTGKFFSGHRAIEAGQSAIDDVGIKGWEDYAFDWYHLFDCYFFTKTAQQAVRKIFMLAEKITGPDVQQLAPIHGPIVREQCWKLMAKYEAWLEQKLRKESKRDFEVLVMYASAYGHTKSLAASISKGLASSGVRVIDMNLEHTPPSEITKALESADGFCIGSPTLGGEMPSQVKEALGMVLGVTTKKPCGVFGSYGWSGEAVDELQFRLKDNGFPICFDPIRAKFKPTEEILKNCEASGTRMSQKLAQDIKAKKRSRVRVVSQIQATTSAGSAMDAFGKIRTSQCVMTSKTPDGEDAVGAVSWVSQASFDPPGLSLSIPKPRSKDQEWVDAQVEKLLDAFRVQGALTKDDAIDVLNEVYGVGNEPEVLQAIYAINEDDDDEVTQEELTAACAKDSFFRAQLLKFIKTERAAKGDVEDEMGPKTFVLNMVPATGDVQALLDKPVAHKKAKATNGCTVIAGVHSFLECEVASALDAGNHLLLYCHVKTGKVMDDKEKTDVVPVASMLKKMMVQA